MSTPGGPVFASSAAGDFKSRDGKTAEAVAAAYATAKAGEGGGGDDFSSLPRSGPPFPSAPFPSGGGGGGGGGGAIVASSLPLSYVSLLQLIDASHNYNDSMKKVLRTAIELINRVGGNDNTWMTHAIYTITSAPITRLRDGEDGESDCRQLLTSLAPGDISSVILGDSALFQNANPGTKHRFTIRALLTWAGEMKRIPLLHRYAQLTFMLAHFKGGSRNSTAVQISARYMAEQREILAQLVMSCGRCDD